LTVKLTRVPEEHHSLSSRIQERLVPRPSSTLVLVSDGYVSPEKTDLLVVVDSSLPIEEGSVAAKQYDGWDDIQLKRYREGRSKAGILGRVTWIIRRP
jgi:hypothetical protein